MVQGCDRKMNWWPAKKIILLSKQFDGGHTLLLVVMELVHLCAFSIVQEIYMPYKHLYIITSTNSATIFKEKQQSMNFFFQFVALDFVCLFLCILSNSSTSSFANFSCKCLFRITGLIKLKQGASKNAERKKEYIILYTDSTTI